MRTHTWLIGLLATAAALLVLGTSPAVATAPAGPVASAAPTASSTGGCPVDIHVQKQQLRGMWIASVVNIDWPSKPGLTAEQQKAELVQRYDTAVAQHDNAVFVQVRPTADAFWPSTLEPWSKYLTGTQGTDPGYDPLAFAVEQAHQRNLEFHAWFNPYRITMNLTTDVAALAPDHPARQHPDWTVAYGGKLYYNPGIPQARRFVESAIMDAVGRYDIDAVHFDDYFYPYPVAGETFQDAAQFAQYGNGMSLGNWRRDNINTLVIELGHQIKAAKPWVKFGVSPFAVWMNQSNDPRGSATTAGAETYADLYADTRRWVQEEWVDYIAPQVYWARGFAPADYDVLTDWWATVVGSHHVHLFIGQATYKVGLSTQSPAWIADPGELSNHLARNAELPQVKGDIYFSAKDVAADRLGATSLVTENWYSHPALVPAMPWIDHRAPRAPVAVPGGWFGSGTTLTLVRTDPSTTSYAVYRLDRTPDRVRSGDCRIADARNLVAIFRASGRVQRWSDPSAVPGTGYTYVVTALDRTWNESPPAQVSVRG